MSTIIDTHTHLYDITDVPSVLMSTSQAGVSDIIALGVDYSSNMKHLKLWEQCAPCRDVARNVSTATHFPRIYLALGIHPGHMTEAELDACLPFFNDILTRGEVNVVAIGEIGLDFSYKPVQEDKRKRDLQREGLRQQLALARTFSLPVVVHSRQAGRQCLDMVKDSGVKQANFHWYSGPLDLLKDILDAGHVISVSPALEYSPQVKEAAGYAPLDRILVETDTPTRGWYPKDVWRTLDALCAIKGLDRDQALAAVNANARAFFDIQ